jgi:hypothetical protein
MVGNTDAGISAGEPVVLEERCSDVDFLEVNRVW